MLVGSKELNQYTGDGVGPENKLTVSTILLIGPSGPIFLT